MGADAVEFCGVRVEWKRDGWEDGRDGWKMKSAGMMGADGCDFRPGAGL